MIVLGILGILALVCLVAVCWAHPRWIVNVAGRTAREVVQMGAVLLVLFAVVGGLLWGYDWWERRERQQAAVKAFQAWAAEETERRQRAQEEAIERLENQLNELIWEQRDLVDLERQRQVQEALRAADEQEILRIRRERLEREECVRRARQIFGPSFDTRYWCP